MLPAPAQLRPRLPALGGAAGRCPRPQMWPPVPRPPSRTIAALPTPPWRWCPTEVLDFGRTRTFPLPKSLNLYLYRRSLGVSERAGPSWGGLVLGPAGRTCWQPPPALALPGRAVPPKFPKDFALVPPLLGEPGGNSGWFWFRSGPPGADVVGDVWAHFGERQAWVCFPKFPKIWGAPRMPRGSPAPLFQFWGSRAGRGCNTEQFWQTKPKESCHKPAPSRCCCPKTNPRGAQEGSPVPGCSPPAPLAPSPVRLEQENQIMSCM